MTGATGARISILFITDIARLVNRVAFAVTGFELLSFKMRLVARAAGWNIGMRSVAIVASQLGMLAGKLLQLVEGTAMADRAGFDQRGGHGNPGRGMGIIVTGGTIDNLFTVRQQVAIPAFRHQFRPVVLDRTIGMKTLVTVLTLEPVTPSRRLDVCIE